MSVAETKFRIRKDQDFGHWILTCPKAFHAVPLAIAFPTFTAATEAFIAYVDVQCPICGRGRVRHTDWGWECQACGSSDVAVGCTR